jgi:hypothetical protein
MAQIVLLGGGIGGVSCAYELNRRGMRSALPISTIRARRSSPCRNSRRNVNWAASGRWVYVAKVAFEKYFLRKVRAGTTEPYFEKTAPKLLDIGKIKRPGLIKQTLGVGLEDPGRFTAPDPPGPGL